MALLALTLLIATSTAMAYDIELNGIYYSISAGRAYVTYKDNSFNSYSGDVVIPAQFTYEGETYTVLAIWDYAFNSCENLTSVSIPNTVTEIGNSVFLGCPKLTSVSIPNSVTSIGNYAFDGCSALKKITIPNSVTKIGFCALENCTSLTSVTLSNKLEPSMPAQA